MEYTTDDVTDPHLLAYRPGQQCYGAGIAALLGDGPARHLVADHLTEFGEEPVDLFTPGQTVLIETVTLYYVGRVVERQGPFVVLDNASWVHWTGRKSTLARLKKFTGFASSENKPRTEYVGLVAVGLAAIVAVLPGEWQLPTESVS